MKKVFACIFMLLLVPCLYAKEKEYKEATMLKMQRWQPNAAFALQSAVSGYNIKPAWIFRVQVGDWIYDASVEKRFGKIDEAEWPANSAVKVRFDIKGGGVATRTRMYIQKADGKELESDVLVITDKDGKHDYCGKLKCDPVNAEKKYQKAHGE